jgi:hypothetical protein
MADLELDDADKATFAAFVKQTIAANAFPMSPCVSGDPGQAGGVANAARKPGK